jgi:hypothetical protein
MSIATTAPSTVQIRRSHLLTLIVGVATVAAAITWAVTTVAAGSGNEAAAKSASVRNPLTAVAKTPEVSSIFKLTAARLAAGALGTGYQLPVKQTGPTVESVLAAMNPQTRRWTKNVMALTFEQLAAGAAGSP